MRTELAPLLHHRRPYTATFSRYGQKTVSYYLNDTDRRTKAVRTLLFTDVTDRFGKAAADHVWMTDGVQLRRLKLEPGDRVSFEARVERYRKRARWGDGDDGRTLVEDYKLSNPTKVRKLGTLETVTDVEQATLFG